MYLFNGKLFLGGFTGRVLSKIYRELKKVLQPRITIKNPYGKNILFVFNSFIKFSRIVSIFSKEKGTIDWILKNLKKGDVFYDVGANIGQYTLFSLSLDKNIKAYAFEPHAINAGLLIENLLRNKYSNRAKVITSALNNKNSFEYFDYKLIEPGSSFSQFRNIDQNLDEEAYLFSEIKYGCTLDFLIEKKIIQEPSLIKIDVDGNELKVLEGMKNFLIKNNSLKSIQLEMNVGEYEKIESFMKSVDFIQTEHHYGKTGKKLRSQGLSRKEIPHHVIYEPKKNHI